MLGFGAYSQLAFSQVVPSAFALLTLSSVAAASTAQPVLYDAQGAASLVSTLSSTAISGFTNVYGEANITPSAVSGTFNLDIDYDAKANLTVSSVSGSISANALADIDAQASTILSSTSAYLTIYLTDFADEDAQARAFIPPAVATGNVNIDYDAKANTVSSNVSASTYISGVDTEAKANTTIATQLLQFVSPDVDTYSVNNISIGSVSAIFNLDIEYQLNNFDYEALADSYETDRTIYLPTYYENPLIYVAEENYTVYVDKAHADNTVYIRS